MTGACVVNPHRKLALESGMQPFSILSINQSFAPVMEAGRFAQWLNIRPLLSGQRTSSFFPALVKYGTIQTACLGGCFPGITRAQRKGFASALMLNFYRPVIDLESFSLICESVSEKPAAPVFRLPFRVHNWRKSRSWDRFKTWTFLEHIQFLPSLAPTFKCG